MTEQLPPRRIELPYRVRFDEAGPDGQLRASGYLRYAQDVAWQHSDLNGFTRRWYRERELLWLVRCVDLRLEAGVENGETVTVSTQVVGWRRVWARRQSEVRRGDGATAGTVQTDWVLLYEDGRPARVPAVIAERFSDGTGFKPGRVVLGDPDPGTTWTTELRVRPQDLDPMDHVNNAAYVDYLDEVLAARPGGMYTAAQLAVATRCQLEYVRPAAPGERLTAVSWQARDGVAIAMVGGAGDEVLRARVS